MSAPQDLNALVKRVVGRVMSERGRVDHPRGRPEVGGVERPARVRADACASRWARTTAASS
jgi:hypothetical protein